MAEQYGFSIRGGVAQFYQTLEEMMGGRWLPMIAFYVATKQKTEHYRWLGQTPAMRQWIAGRQPQGLRDEAYTLDVEKFEATLDFEVDDIIRGLGPQIMVRIQEMADRTAEHWELLGTGVIDLGVSASCYDGEPFFYATHPGTDKVGAQSNLLTSSSVSQLKVGVATAPTALEFAMAVMACIGALWSLKDDQGLPMNGGAKNFLLMVPVPLWAPAVGPALLNVAGGSMIATNPLEALAEKMGVNIKPIVNPLLTWTDQFALFRTDGRAKPFIMQEEYSPKVSVKGPGSEYEHDTDRNQFGVKASRNVGYGYWQHAALATLSTS